MMLKAQVNRLARLARRHAPRRLLVVRAYLGEEAPASLAPDDIVIYVTRQAARPLPGEEDSCA